MCFLRLRHADKDEGQGKMKKKSAVTFACIFFCAAMAIVRPIFADEQEDSFQALYKFSQYTAAVLYNQKAFPGDPLFIKITLSPSNKKTRKLIGQNLSCHAQLVPAKGDGNASRKTDFYQTDFSEKRMSDTLIGAFATSTYMAPGEYIIRLALNAYGLEENSIELPVAIGEKEFVKETIPLDRTNTAIRTDSSKERMSQIEKLNRILGEKNADAVYELSGFSYPTDATRRTSFFADRRVFVYSDGRKSESLHYGIDWGVPTGTNVAACGRGKVVLAEFRISTGWSVCIEHFPGLYSLYYHLSSLDVSDGQIVGKGQSLGLSGATGLATGPHIHWEVRLNGEAVNPDWFIGRQR